MNHSSRIRGFTLIELLLALSLFATVAVTLSVTFQSGIRSWRRGEEFSARLQEVRVVLEVIAEDLRNARSLPGKSLSGTPSEISFYTLKRSPQDENMAASKFVKVTYRLSPLKEVSGNVLEKLELPTTWSEELEEVKFQKMTIFLKNIRFEYAKASNDKDHPPSWVDHWKEMDGFPKGVRAHLTLEEDSFTKTFFIPGISL